MMERLKGTLKNELEALKSGQPIEEGTPKKVAGTPRKRKAKAEADEGATPSKRGRKKKQNEEEVVPEVADDEEVLGVKPELVNEELDIEPEV
jgi:hypothetical protein